MTECNIKQLTFSFLKRRKLTVDFEGGEITSDAGLLLIRQADDSLGLVSGLTECINEKRDIRYIEHELVTLLRQRIYQIVAGYELLYQQLFLLNINYQKFMNYVG